MRIRLADETEWTRTGKVDFVDNSFAPRSGTIRTRAVVDNKNQLLTPGIFGRVQLFGGEYDALMIPDSAIISDQARKIVFTVGDDNVVKAKPVTLGPIVDGLRVVRDGLAADRPGGAGRARQPDGAAGRQGRAAKGRDQHRQSQVSAPFRRHQPMRFSHFFIDRPIFASVLSIIILIVGAIAQRNLPIAEYPEIAPPTVNVTATYPGASAEVIAATVATPLELEINGVDDMLYINSQSTGDGRLSINVVFKPGVDIDQAQVNVQNRVAVAQPRLPQDVQRLGVVVRKASPDLMMVVHMTSPDGSRDQQYISNYATLNVKDVLGRVDGVGNVQVFGARDYSMRVWLDPARVAGHNLTASEVVAALRAANLQVAAGSINQAPAVSPGAFTLSVQTLGRLSAPGGVRQHRAARRTRRFGDAPARRRPHRTGRAGLHGERLSRQQERHGARHLPAPGVERARHLRRRQGGDGAPEEGSSPRASTIRWSTIRRSSSRPRSTR